MEDLENVSVGDKLFVKSGYYDKGRIEIVVRVTPTGRVITQSGTFRKNGRLIGGSSWQITSARRATQDDISGVHRFVIVSKIEKFRKWNELSPEDLKMVSETISKYQSSNSNK